MSLSLNSLLNPSPDADSTASATAPPPRRDSLPPIQYAQSPTQYEATSPLSAHMPPPSSHSYPPPTDSEAAHTLVHSDTLPPVSPQWYSRPQTSDSSSYHRSTYSGEHRPGSSGSIQLPPPSPPFPTGERTTSSSTLHQYQTAPHSPEQRRSSLLSSGAEGMTLPPIQNLGRSGSLQHDTGLPDHMQSDANHESVSASVAKSAAQHSDLPPNSYQTVSDAPVASPSPAVIKQEKPPTPRASSPATSQQTPFRTAEGDTESIKAVTTLKNEHSLRTHSPLRESSVPVQSTEMPTPEPTASRKRPAPSRTKKGTAVMKKARPAKKRKIESKRSATPSSKSTPFNGMSGKGTPAGSSPAPTTRSQSAEADDEPYDDDDEGPAGSDDELYCICRKPDNGTFMIGCDGTCDDWFHGKCVGIEERDKNLIDKYICPNCQKAGVGRTSWKRICRRSGCRQPARMGKTKNGKDGSKYCSEECGVLYFRDMTARARGREDAAKHRSTRRKSSMVVHDQYLDEDLGARGGVIAAGELKALVNASKTAEDFKKLGDGVLSPPSTPSTSSPTTNKNTLAADFNESETKALEDISRQKDEARRKHQLLKDRMKFVTMAKQAAARTATEKELKPKEYCGYDSRIEWTDAQFAAWRNSKVGKQAFELETLATEEAKKSADAEGDAVMDFNDDSRFMDFEVCDRKKCARHLEWGKLAVDDVRFEIGDNSDRMRVLEREEKGIRERAALRGKGGSLVGEGTVEVVGLGIDVPAPKEIDVGPTGGQAMEVDAAA